MKVNSLIKHSIIPILSLVVIFLACGKKSTDDPPKDVPFDFTFERCTEEGYMGKLAGDFSTGNVEIYTFKDTIMVIHSQAYYNDCADVTMKAEKTKDGYEFSESLEGDTAICNDKCDFKIVGYLYRLSKGTYKIVVADAYRSKFEAKWMEVNPDTGTGPQP